MLWPNADDAAMRAKTVLVSKLRAELHDASEDDEVRLSVRTVRELMSSPTGDGLRQMEADRTRKGFIAGQVLCTMFVMDRFAEHLPKRGAAGATLSKALAVQTAWAASGGAFGDGVALPLSDRMVKDAWIQLRPVAHLWAALHINAAWPWAPKGSELHPEHFGKFLRVGAGFQEFGIQFTLTSKQTKQSAPLIDPGTAWQLDPLAYPPLRLGGVTFDEIADSPMMRALMKYVGRN